MGMGMGMGRAPWKWNLSKVREEIVFACKDVLFFLLLEGIVRVDGFLFEEWGEGMVRGLGFGLWSVDCGCF